MGNGTATGDVPATTRPGAALATVLVAQGMLSIDNGLVNVGLPAIRDELQATPAQVQLILAGYVLAFAVTLITGGRLGDVYGRRRLLAVGLSLFVAAALANGLAPSAAVLVVLRLVQGLGAALIAPQVLAIIQVTFPPDRRARALVMFGVVVGLSAAVGQVSGGLLVGADLFGLGWRMLFLAQLPLGLAAIAGTLAVLPESRSATARRLDLGGVALGSASVFLIVFPLIEGRAKGWPLWSFALLALSAPAGVAFVWFERRVSAAGRSPLIDLSLFRERAFAAGVGVTMLLFSTFSPFLLIYTLTFQSGLGYSPLQASLAFTAMPCAFLVSSRLSIVLLARVGDRILWYGIAVFLVGTAATFAVATWRGPDLGLVEIAPVLALHGFGQGWLITPLFGIVLRGVHADDAGAAGGVLATAQQVTIAIGVAVVGVVFFWLLGDRTDASGYVRAFRWSLPFTFAMQLAAACLLPLITRTPPVPPAVTVPAMSGPDPAAGRGSSLSPR